MTDERRDESQGAVVTYRPLPRRRGRDRFRTGAEGATAPETLRQKDRGERCKHLERDAQLPVEEPASAEGVTLSGKATDGAPFEPARLASARTQDRFDDRFVPAAARRP